MKVKVKAKNKYKSYELIEHLILLNKEDLAFVNQKIRINNPSLYVTAFRLAREKNSIDCYIKALNILRPLDSLIFMCFPSSFYHKPTSAYFWVR